MSRAVGAGATAVGVLLLTGCAGGRSVGGTAGFSLLSFRLLLGDALAVLALVIGLSSLILVLLALRAVRRRRAAPVVPLVTAALLLAALVVVGGAALVLVATGPTPLLGTP